MTREEKELALYCLKASSDYYLEVCEECIKYPNCDHTGQDDVTETIIKVLEQDPVLEQEPVIEPLERLAESTAKTAKVLERLSEQERILDKIRAEIFDIEEGISSYHNDRPWVFKDEVLQIIDKYRKGN